MSAAISLLVGLGNPGPKYQSTRHNAGFWFLDQVAQAHGVSFHPETRFQGEVAKVVLEGEVVWLLKPSTFMNRSGQAVAALARYYKLESAALLVAHDELDLPPGQLRIKRGGGHAGHNGLRDIISHLDPDYLRLRIGIGRPLPAGRAVTDYVLGSAPAAEHQQIEEAIEDAVRALPLLIAGETAAAMNRLHGRGKA